MQLAHASPGRSADRVGNVVQFPSDESLLRLIAGGAQGAMEILFKRHRVRVFRFALSMTRDRTLAEEIVSDVFLDIWGVAGSFQGRSQVSTWLLSIARHKALSSLRRHAHERAYEELAETIEDTADNPEVGMQRKQTGAILTDCLQHLPTIYREVIDLIYYHRQSIEEVANILEIPKNTVKSRMFYARKRLARALVVKTDARIPSLA
jgi:RNA polymerase sigma-70 factor, ECF subfamily